MTNLKEQFDLALNEAKAVFDSLREFHPSLQLAAKMCADAVRNGNKILICGNGGSACDAQHLAGELAGRYKRDRRALPAIALNTDGAVLTCIGNDYQFSQVFSRQVEALGSPGDILIVFTTSGNSPNVLAALHVARERQIPTIAFLGRGGGVCQPASELCFTIQHGDTARIQEAHQFLMHCLVEEIEAQLFD